MTDHPCRGMSATAVQTFEMIAISEHPVLRRKTIKALLARGLIVQIGMRQLGRDRFGAIEIPEYAVPIDVHMQWCQHCAEQPWPEGFDEDGNEIARADRRPG